MLRQRVLTAIVALVVLLLALFVLPAQLTRLIIAALMLVAAWEWSGFLSLQSRYARASYVMLIALLAAAVFWYQHGGPVLQSVMQLAIAWWLAAFLWLFFYPTGIPRVLAWVCGAFVIVPAWLAIDWLYRLQPLLLLMVLTIVWAADIGAYFVGKKIGRVKLAPQISPGKTWEGVIGGLLAVTVLALAVGNRANLDLAVLLPLCLAVAVISVVGDLTVSVFKRHAGVKDSGSLFPGHGGVLDRIDSIAAATPLFVVGAGWAGLT